LIIAVNPFERIESRATLAGKKRMRESRIVIADTELRVVEDGAGDPLLFLHGAGGWAWTPLLASLSRTFRVIAPEHPGFGRSSVPDWMLSVGDLAFFYLDALRALGLDRLHLVGHSLGGWTAAEMAIRSTARLKSLALLAPAGTLAPEAPYDDIFAWTPEETARHLFFDPALAETFIKSVADADIDVALQNRVAAARLAWSPRLHNPQLRHWLHLIDVPTLVVWGQEDRIVPFACHRAFLDEIPGAELATLPACGHALTIEQADGVSERLKAFFARASS
jgi:pimeloyl-ACP methyl ester carboxylesterase